MRFLASATVRLQGRAQALKDAAWICRSVASSADAWSSEDAAVSLYARAEARANARCPGHARAVPGVPPVRS